MELIEVFAKQGHSGAYHLNDIITTEKDICLIGKIEMFLFGWLKIFIIKFNYMRNIFGKADYVKVDDKNRFYYMLQQMQTNRWRITVVVLGLFLFIITGINAGVFIGTEIGEDWKEMLLILLGAFVGNLNKVVDYWFNSEDRDKMLIQKVDEEDGSSLSKVTDFPESMKTPTEMPDYTHLAKKEPKVTNTKVAVDEDGDGVMDGWDFNNDGIIDEYFPHRNCEHVWGDKDNDGFEECQNCGLLRSDSQE